MINQRNQRHEKGYMKNKSGIANIKIVQLTSPYLEYLLMDSFNQSFIP